jgi:hypothetical protein
MKRISKKFEKVLKIIKDIFENMIRNSVTYIEHEIKEF